MIAKSLTSAEEALDHLNNPAADAPPRVEVPADTRTRAQLDEQIAKTEVVIARTHKEPPSGDEPALTIGRVALARLRKLRDKAQDVPDEVVPPPSITSIARLGAPRGERPTMASAPAAADYATGHVQPAAKPSRLLTLSDVLERIAVSPQTIESWEAEGKFPQRIPLPDVDDAFWLEREIDAWSETAARPPRQG